MIRTVLVVAALTVGITGCIPYTVASTALPVPVGEARSNAITYLLPSVELDTTSRVGNHGRALSGDLELRFGMDSSSDIGLRLTSFTGIVVNFKRLLTRRSDSARVNVAVMPGIGIVNAGDHVHGELTLIVSGAERARARRLAAPSQQVVPYGGLRLMQVAPIADGAVHDSPTAGGFLGTKIYSGGLALTIELGVFHDRSALGVRKGSVVIIPAFSIERIDGPGRREPRPRGGPRWPYPLPPGAGS